MKERHLRPAIKFVFIVLSALLLPTLSLTCFAEVRLPKLISDGLVLQRDTQNKLWGWAKPNELVTITLNNKPVSKTTAKKGYWSVDLAPQPAGGPHKIQITGSNRIEVSDVYFGDVWIASGQSNMQTPMSRLSDKFPIEIASANFPLIRMFTVPGSYDFNTPHDDVDGGDWKAVNTETINALSGVAYFFAKSIHRSTGVPIGIINSSFGGAPAEAWMSEESLKAFPHYLEAIKDFKDPQKLADIIKKDQQNSNAWYQKLDSTDLGNKTNKEWYRTDTDDSKWSTTDIPNFWSQTDIKTKSGVVWFRKDFTLPETFSKDKPAKLLLGRIVNADVAYINGVKVGGVTYEYPPRRYTAPSNLLKPGKNTVTVRVTSNSGNGGFVPDKPYSLSVGGHEIDLKGQWRYKEGASMPSITASQFNQYMQPLGRYNSMIHPLLNTTIKGVIWYQGESNIDRAEEYATLFPAMIRNWRQDFKQGDFPFIYVQLANYLEAKVQPSESDWAETRFSQFKALSMPNTAMAVSIDSGEWNDLHPLDKKTVGERLAIAAQSIAYGDKRVAYSGPIFDTIKRDEDKLILTFTQTGKGLTYRGPKLTGFAIKGKYGKYVWADAKIVGDQVIVWNSSVYEPSHVRYGWADNPSNANLYNKDGLPASPFEAQTQ